MSSSAPALALSPVTVAPVAMWALPVTVFGNKGAVTMTLDSACALHDAPIARRASLSSDLDDDTRNDCRAIHAACRPVAIHTAQSLFSQAAKATGIERARLMKAAMVATRASKR